MQRPDVRASNNLNRPSLLHWLSPALQNIPVVPAVSQSTVPHAQACGLAAAPSVLTQLGTELHLFSEDVQKSPASQSAVPHAQACGLGAEPSVVAHTSGRELHWPLLDVSQYKPVVASQSVVPQAQFAELAV